MTCDIHALRSWKCADCNVNPLTEYFEQNWKHEPYPIIDHALRVEKMPDGSFHFYIHPANTGGITSDFVVDRGIEVRRRG